MNATLKETNVSTMTEAISIAKQQEARVSELILPKSEIWGNTDFTVNHLPKEPGQKGLELVGPALRQVAASVADMPASTVDYCQKKKYGHHFAGMFNDASEIAKGRCKFRTYEYSDTKKSVVFGVTGPNYEEFPLSTVLELARETAKECLPGTTDLQVGLYKKEGGYWDSNSQFKPQGYFGRTIIQPWESQIAVPLGEFNGPRDDRYIYGFIFRQKSDGTGSAEVRGFCFRVLCENGIIEQKLTQVVKVAHKGRDAFPRLRNAIRNGIIGIHAHSQAFNNKINRLAEIKLEDPFAALTAVAEKEMGKRRLVNAATTILRKYQQEMGDTAEAVVNTITDFGTREKKESVREQAQILGGRLLDYTPDAWLNAQARGRDILALRA
jgi:hypothetical protein